MPKHNGKTRGIFERPKGSGVWWIRWTCHYGHDHREKIGPKGLAKAEYQRRKVAVRTEDYCLTRAEAARRESRPTLFADAASRYLAWAKQEYVRSYTFREKALKHLIAAFGSKALEEISTSGVEQYQISRRDAGAAPGTVNRERAVLSHLFKKAVSWKLVRDNPVIGTGKLEEPEGRPRPLTLR